MHKNYLLAPGPTPVPERARLAMAKSLMHHRGPEFKILFGEVREQLQWLFETSNDVLILTCSGTGAFEASIINFTKQNDTLIAIGGGKFSERWAKVARAYGLNVISMDVPWGKSADPAQLQSLLVNHPECKMVTVCASETSTGVYNDVENLAKVVRQYSSALFAVDGITAVGVHRIPMDAWDIDILVSGSQKAFGIPPGLGFVAANDRAWEMAKDSDHPKFYLDLKKERLSQANHQTAFTPAISLIVALREVMTMMMEEGLDNLVNRHQINANATREGVKALGLKIFPDNPSNAVTAAMVPDGLDAKRVVKYMREALGVTIAGGQDSLATSVFRIGHIGFFDRADILMALSSLELALQHFGYLKHPGMGVHAAQTVFLSTGQ